MNPSERLKQLLNDPEYRKDLELFAKKLSSDLERRERYCKKIENYIAPLSNIDFLNLIIKFSEWETKYEDRLYKNRICGESMLSNLLFDVIWTIGKESKIYNEYFLQKKYIYKGLTFKLYVGQGSFVRIMKGKKLIFQST